MQVQVLKNTMVGMGSVPQYDNVWHCITRTFAGALEHNVLVDITKSNGVLLIIST